MYARVMPNHGEKSLDPVTQAKITDMLRSFIGEMGGQSAAAKALGVSQGYLSEFLGGKRGGGQKLIRGLGKYRPEIVELFLTGTSRHVSQDARYPNREQAIAHLVDDGAGSADEVRQAADAFAVALKSESDLTVLEWVRSIDRTIRDIRRGRTVVPVAELGDEGIEDTFRSVIKRKQGA